MDKHPKIQVKLDDIDHMVEVTEIDFTNRTLKWMFRGHLENTATFDEVERWEVYHG